MTWHEDAQNCKWSEAVPTAFTPKGKLETHDLRCTHPERVHLRRECCMEFGSTCRRFEKVQ
jgi:hypothetical protein